MAYTTLQFVETTDPGESYAFDVFLFILSVFNVVVLISFIVINKIWMRYQYGPYRWNGRLRACSFVLECLSGCLVILIATTNSMKRNRNISWLQ